MALLFISFLIYQQWQVDYNTPKPEVTEQAQVSEVTQPHLQQRQILLMIHRLKVVLLH